MTPEEIEKANELVDQLSLVCDGSEIPIVIVALFNFQNTIVEHLSEIQYNHEARENLVKSYKILYEHVKEVMLSDKGPKLH